MPKYVEPVFIPNKRPDHHVFFLVGGIVIFLSLCISNLFFEQISWPFLFWMGLVLVIGVLDDLFDVSYRIRLGAHAAVVVGIFLTDGLLVTNIGSIFWNMPAVDFFGLVAVLFTIMGVIGAINSVNMVDGVDGLLASLVLASLVVLAIIGLLFGSVDTPVSIASIFMLIGTLAAFAVVNCRFLGLQRAMAFMGDAGSTVLGFFLTYALIALSQAPANVISPILAGWILGLPLLDASAVIAKRLLDGKAPFHPDRTHLHHLLMDAGHSVNKTVTIIVCAHVALMAFASAMYMSFGNMADPFLFWGFVAMVLVRVGYGLAWSRASVEKQQLGKATSASSVNSAGQSHVASGLGMPVAAEKNISGGVSSAEPERSTE